MNGKIIQLDSEDHREVQALLPWYIVERLNDAERRRVEAHLADCPRCQDHVAWQRTLCAARDEPASSIDVEQGLAAMLAKIGADERATARATAADPAPVGDPVHARLPGRRPMVSTWWRWALGFQFASILGLTLLLFIPRSPDDHYRTLGAPMASSANLVVVFRPTATEEEIRQALRASEARLVGGPTVTDAYLLSAAPARRTAALERLRSDSAVIRVDSLDAAPK
ncbi:MAG: zf-HC2 domain-containing protein [Caldimonas sp.]